MDDNQALLLQISADLNKLKSDWNKANGIVDDSMSRMERRAKKSADQIEKDAGAAGHRGGAAFSRNFTGEAGKAVVFNRMQMMELAHVGRSVTDGLAAGQNPVRILAMEGGRLAEVFGMGGHGVGGAMAEVSPVVLAAGGAFAVLATVLIAGAAAEMAYEEDHRKLLLTLMGTGAASGLTVKALDDIAEAAAKVGTYSAAMERQSAAAFASIGHVTAENMPAALGILRDYATLTGQKTPEALKQLASAFADPAKGAEELNNSLYFLSTQQLENIRHMQEHGDRAGALKELLKDLSDVTNGAASQMSGLSKIMAELATNFSWAADGAGKFFFELLHGHESGDVAGLKKDLSIYQALLSANPNSEFLKGQVSDIQARIDFKGREDARVKQAPLNKAMADQDALIKQADPKFLRIDADKALVEGLEKAVKNPIQGGRSVAELQEALAGARAKLARDQHGEMRTPKGPKAPADKSDQALSEARKARDQALAAIQEDVLEKAKLEKDAIDDGLKAQIDALNARKDIGSVERAQAKALDEQTAEIRKATIDAKAQNDVEKEALRNRRERDDIEIQLLNTQAQMAPTLKQRQALELEALRRRKVLEDAQRANELDAKRRLATAADKFSGSVTTVSDNGAQKAADANFAADVAKIKAQGPLADYIRGIRDLDTEMENAEVRGLQGLTDGLAQLVVTGGKLGNVLHKVIQDLEYDLAKIGIQKLEQVGLKLLGFDGGGYTGDGARSGGVDGKGGFMAILHPRESVIDHTRGNPSARSASAVMVASPAPYFDLRGAVTTQDLVNQMNQISKGHAAQAVATATGIAKGAQAAWARTKSWEQG